MHLPNSFGLLSGLRDSAPAFMRSVEFRVVETMEEFRTASHLIYTEYLKRNYLLPNSTQLKLSLHQVLPTTTTFIARHPRSGIIGTITLVADSPLGLPMDEVYKAELDELRAQRLQLAEATMLALDTSLFGRGVFTMFHAKKLLLTLRLFKVMFDYLRCSTATDELVACFNPKHKILYDFLQLKPLGNLKMYTGANGNPAIAQHLNISETQRRAKSAAPYTLFYGHAPSPKMFVKKLGFTAQDLRTLFMEETRLLASASPTERHYIQSCYPEYDVNVILKTLPPITPSPLQKL